MTQADLLRAIQHHSARVAISSSRMVAHYTAGATAARGAVVRYL